MMTDYEPFLRVAEDGRIWCLLEDALRIGAGFLPVHDDQQTLAVKLQAPNDSALVSERTLIDAFSDNPLTIKGSIAFERDGFHYVDAEGFVDWLSQFIARTQAKIAFPNELASAVSKTKAKAAASLPPVAEQEFESLTLALDGWFEKNLNSIPIPLRKRIKREFVMSWDHMTASKRRKVALQLDYQRDPAKEQERKYWWNFFERLDHLKAQLEEWKSTATPTASDLAKKETRIKELQQEIDRMELQKRQDRGDYYPKHKQVDAARGATHAVDYIAYPKAMNILRERWNAAPEELAIWIFLGPEMDGLAAYMNANELNPPPNFSFTYHHGCEDYLSPLMTCWFRQDDIDRFKPADRYIMGSSLIERWGKLPGIVPEAFIRAKIDESRLLDMHPTFGSTRGTFSEDTFFPPLSTCLFSLKNIEQIEVEDALLYSPVLANSDTKAVQDCAEKKGGRPKGILAEAVEEAYLHFHATGNVDILKPGNIRSFLKSFSSLVKGEAPSKEFGNGNVSDYLAERIKEVKTPRVGDCSVTTQDRKERAIIYLGKKHGQKEIAKLLTKLRKKYPLPT